MPVGVSRAPRSPGVVASPYSAWDQRAEISRLADDPAGIAFERGLRVSAKRPTFVGRSSAVALPVHAGKAARSEVVMELSRHTSHHSLGSRLDRCGHTGFRQCRNSDD